MKKHFITGMYVQGKAEHVQGSVLPTVSGIQWGSWNTSPSDKGALCLHARLLSSHQSCPTLCNPIVCSLPGSSVHGILQARILQWVAVPSFRITLNCIKDIYIGKEDIKLYLLADDILYNFSDLRTMI